MVFNIIMIKVDAKLIEVLGGPAEVARMIGIYGQPGAVQRVFNWKKRGIPPSVRLMHLDIFPLPERENEKAL